MELGYTSMDLSSSLAWITQLLNKEQFESLNVRLCLPKYFKLGRYLVRIDARAIGVNTLFRSSGLSLRIDEAFLRALSELGETLILQRCGFQSRCGIAGGLSKSGAIQRAKSELIERDAFLYHYRSGAPFSTCQKLTEDIVAFDMEVPVNESLTAILVTDEASARGANRCLWFGTSAARSRTVAIEKALQEYLSIRANHLALNPNGKSKRQRCFAEASQPHSDLDQHHAASSDPRNLKRFVELCAGMDSVLPPLRRNPLDQSRWEIQSLTSPILGLKFARAIHPDLIPMEFGIPESWASTTPPLLHPFW